MKLCIECGKRPIQIKKRKLCSTCYVRLQARMRRKGQSLKDQNGLTPPTIAKREQMGELEFVRNYFSHSNWIPHPAVFKFNGQKYTPDFYDCERNVWIEVSATRQAYHANKEKYQLFRQYYPLLNFEIRKPTGELLNEASRDKNW